MTEAHHGSRYDRQRSATICTSGTAAASCFMPRRERAVRSRYYGMRTPEIARAITRRWISEVPSKIV